MKNFNECSSISFSPEEVRAGFLKAFLDFVLNFNLENDDSYIETHITTDSYATIVEFSKNPYDESYTNGHFEFVDEEHVILKEVRFPDGHYEYLPDEEEEEILNEWLKENPGWVKGDWGNWYNEKENEQLREDLLKDGEN